MKELQITFYLETPMQFLFGFAVGFLATNSVTYYLKKERALESSGLHPSF